MSHLFSHSQSIPSRRIPILQDFLQNSMLNYNLHFIVQFAQSIFGGYRYYDSISKRKKHWWSILRTQILKARMDASSQFVQVAQGDTHLLPGKTKMEQNALQNLQDFLQIRTYVCNFSCRCQIWLKIEIIQG